MSKYISPNGRITFEWDSKNERLEIHGDSEGLKSLAKILEALALKGENDHAHLMTQEWGGSELSADQQNLAASLIHHVKVLVWN